MTKQDLAVDAILDNVVKPSGLWQWTTALLVSATITSTVLFPIFGNTMPAHRCLMEEDIETWIMTNLNSTFSFANISRMIEGETWLGCSRDASFWDVNTFKKKFGINENRSQIMQPCPQGYIYEYSHDQYPTSIAQEWNLVCDYQWLVPLSTSGYMMASIFGLILGSWMADAYGRKMCLMFTSTTELLCGIGVTFAPNYVCFLLFRFLIGGLNTAQISVSVVIFMELTTPKHRAKFSSFWSLFNDLIHPLCATGLAYLIGNWRWLHAAIFIPKLLCLGYFFVISESPRWLISKGRLKHAKNVLFRGFRWNHSKLFAQNIEGMSKEQFLENIAIYDENFITDVMETKSMPVESIGGHVVSGFTNLKEKLSNCSWKVKPPVLFSTRQLIMQTLLSTTVFFGLKASFFGVLFYANSMRGPIYLVAAINALAGVPGPVVSTLLYRFMKTRKVPLLIVTSVVLSQLLIGSVFTLVVKPSTDYCLIACVYISVGLMISMFNMLYVYIPEIFPAHIRSQGLGFAMGIGRLGSVASAFINNLDGSLGHGAPLLVYFTLLLIGTVCLVFLPETSESRTSH